MIILHTESSSGWGGQEIRILREAEAMRSLGHTVVFAVVRKGILVQRAREKGFEVHEILFERRWAFLALVQLLVVIRSRAVDLVNTHSSLDSWLGGMAGRLLRCSVLRTRHLSTPIRGGFNSVLLYRGLVDFVVTTSSRIIPSIVGQAGLSPEKIRCVATGISPESLLYDEEEVASFRRERGVSATDVLVGTVCFVRSWKGIGDFLQAALLLLRSHPHIKWVVIGGGYFKDYEKKAQELGLEGVVTFTGHLEHPYSAMKALDIFALLSTANEGISQASLQAACLGLPLITTDVGGLPEVCLHGKTGIVVPPFSPERVALAVLQLAEDEELRRAYGEAARALVQERYTFDRTVSEMQSIYDFMFENRRNLITG